MAKALEARATRRSAAPITRRSSAVRAALRAPGRPLAPATRRFMEPRFGHDFARVRIHADGRAADAASGVSARAYTLGRDVVFGAGQYAPGTTAGRRLLAHELAHVVQQQSASAAPAGTIQRYALDCPLKDEAAQIEAGHRRAKHRTSHADVVVGLTGRHSLPGSSPALTDLLKRSFGAAQPSASGWETIQKTFAKLNRGLDENYTYHCQDDTTRPKVCQGGTEAQEVGGDVVLCMNKVKNFSKDGVARLVIHENVHRKAFKGHPCDRIIDRGNGECAAGFSCGGVDEKFLVTNADSYACFAAELWGKKI